MNDIFGTVTVDNVEQIAEALRELLGGKYYTTVHCYEFKGYEPEVRLHQYLSGDRDYGTIGDPRNITVIHHHLEPDRRVYCKSDNPHSQVIICDSYGVGGFSTTRTEAGYDHEFNSPYVHFEHNKVTITNRAPNGLKYYMVYAVEGNIES